MDGEWEPWERRDTETALSFNAFAVYRDAGAMRSLRKTAREVPTDYKVVANWSVTHQWVDRALAWDRYMDRQRQVALVSRQREVAELHDRVAAALLARAVNRITGQNGVTALDPSTLTAREVARLIEVATRVQRSALGMPDHLVVDEGYTAEQVEAGGATLAQVVEGDEREWARVIHSILPPAIEAS